MKHARRALTALAVLLASCAPPREPLLRNPRFSAGGGVTGTMPGVGLHWQTTDGEAHPGWYSLDRGVYRSAPASQRIEYLPGVSDPWATVWQFTPPFSVRPGHVYEASVWCRVDGFEGASLLWGGLRLAVRFMADERTVIEEHRAELDDNKPHDWRRIEVAAAAPPGATRMQVLLYLHSEAGTVWYDDVEVREIEAKGDSR